MHVVNVKPEVVFQGLADPTRIRVLRVLAASRAEACLCELVDSLLEPQYKLSRHLKVLRQVGLLAAEKEGDDPHVLLFPEIPFDQERFLARVDDSVRRYGRCTIGVSEGLRWPDGRFPSRVRSGRPP